jgi:tetratricopeptide (TPR) repeat protein
VWFQWLPLIDEQAQSGDAAGAAQSVKNFLRDSAEFVDQLAPDDAKRPLFSPRGDGQAARLQLAAGDVQAAYTSATKALARIEAVKVPDDLADAVLMKRNVLDGILRIATDAAIRLGHFAQAETLAREALTLPPDRNSYNDMRSRISRIRATLAHALAAQGRNDEARKTLQPALDWYRTDLKAGAKGTTFRQDFAYALYVDAISQAADPAGASQRNADLAEAQAQIDGASDEAKRLVDMRYVASLIAAAHG